MKADLPDDGEALLAALRYPEKSTAPIHGSTLDEALSHVKAVAVARGDQVEASRVWQAETIAEIQRGFVGAFSQLKGGKFYDAWCQFERCEIALRSLHRHHTTEKDDPHRLDYINRMILRWQSLYPYRVFFSPEFLKKKVTCSICGSVVKPRLYCGHTKGALYDGKLCHHIVEKVELLSISVASDPVQRYSVAFLSNEDGSQRDHYNYDVVEFVIDRVASPFHGWTAVKTTRTLPSAAVAHLASEELCPCTSGSKFGECCLGRSEITVPHMEIEFAVTPSSDLPTEKLPY